MNVDAPIPELAAAVQSGQVKAADLVKESLQRINEAEKFHAILEVNPAAPDQASEIDRRAQAGERIGRLAGVPFIAKDNFLTLNTHTTAASHILEPFQAPYQSTAIAKLEAEGAIVVAKANLDAFAHGSSTENSDFGPTKNPYDETKVPGGSSGGSAASVALGLATFAVGTDTGGSIRLPASYCGVVGLKPTYGLVSRNGVVAMASSTDVIGPLTRSVADAALVLDVMAGPDPYDATTIERDSTYELRDTSYEQDGQAARRSPLGALRIGIVKEYLTEGVDPAITARIKAAVQQLETAGAQVKTISLPSVEQALACYYILVPAEISSNLARYDGIKFGLRVAGETLSDTYLKTRDQGFGAEAKRRIMIGTYVLSSGYYDAYYKKAQTVRTKLIAEFTAAFEFCDLLLSPTAPTAAFPLGQKAHDPLAMYLNDVLTVAVNLVGVPAISLPAGREHGLPVGLQLMAPQRGERRLLEAAAAIEDLLGAAARV